MDREGALYDFGPHRDLIGRRVAELGAVEDDRFEIEIEWPGPSFERQAGVQPLPVWVYGRIEAPGLASGAGGGIGVAVALDGTVRATGQYDPNDRSGRFRVLLPEDAVEPGPHVLTVLVIDPATGRAVVPAAR